MAATCTSARPEMAVRIRETAVRVRPELIAALLGAAGVGYRIWLTVMHVPATDSGPGRTGWTRWPLRYEPIPARPTAFPLESTVDYAFRTYLDRTGVSYTVSTAGGYHLYLLPHRIGVPLLDFPANPYGAVVR